MRTKTMPHVSLALMRFPEGEAHFSHLKLSNFLWDSLSNSNRICARQITIIVPSLDFKGLFSSNLGTRVNINQSDWGFWASFSHGMENGVPRQHIAWLSTYDNFLSTHTKFHITETRVFRFIKIIAFVRAAQSFLLSWNFIDLISGRKYGIVW